MEKVLKIQMKPLSRPLPQVSRYSTLATKRALSVESTQVHEQVAKIQKVFKQREAVSRELLESLTTISEQIEYLDGQICEIELKNSNFSSRKDIQEAILLNMRKQIQDYGNRCIDSTLEQFKLLETADKSYDSLYSDMNLDLEKVTDFFKQMCRCKLDELLYVAEQQRAQETTEKDLLKSHEITKFESKASVDKLSEEVSNALRIQDDLEKMLKDRSCEVDQISDILENNRDEIKQVTELLNELNQRRMQHDQALQEEDAASVAASIMVREESSGLSMQIDRSIRNNEAHLAEIRHHIEQTALCRNQINEMRERSAALLIEAEIIRENERMMTETIQTTQQDFAKKKAELQRKHENGMEAREVSLDLEQRIKVQQDRMANAIKAHKVAQDEQNDLYKTLQSVKEKFREAVQAEQVRCTEIETIISRTEVLYDQHKLWAFKSAEHEKSALLEMKRKEFDATHQEMKDAESDLQQVMIPIAEKHSKHLDRFVKKSTVERELLLRKQHELEQSLQELESKTSASPSAVSEEALERHIARELRIQEDAMEATFQLEIKPQLNALEELSSGRRLAMEFSKGMARLEKMRMTRSNLNCNALAQGMGANSAQLSSTSAASKRKAFANDQLNQTDGLKTVSKEKMSSLPPALVSPTWSSSPDWFLDSGLS